MAQRYEIIEGLTLPKSGSNRKQFYTTIFLARRNTDGQLGFLFQHQQKLKTGGRRKLGSNFFVPQKDLPGFINVFRQVVNEHGENLNRTVYGRLKGLLTADAAVSISSLAEEISALEAQLNELSKGGKAKIDGLQREIAKRDGQLAKISNELEKVRRQRQKVRILEMERLLPVFQQQLEEFKQLVKNGVKIAKKQKIKQETIFQEFLTQHFWMFGPQYISVQPKPNSSARRIPDLLIQRADGFNDVIELENPTDDLFVNVKKRPEQSKALKEALAQVMDYVDDYALRYRDEFYDSGLDTYKPTGIIVIGRQGGRDLERRRRQLNSYLHGIEIWTYDDLFANAERVISLLKSGPLSHEEKGQ